MNTHSRRETRNCWKSEYVLYFTNIGHTSHLKYKTNKEVLKNI